MLHVESKKSDNKKQPEDSKTTSVIMNLDDSKKSDKKNQNKFKKHPSDLKKKEKNTETVLKKGTTIYSSALIHSYYNKKNLTPLSEATLKIGPEFYENNKAFLSEVEGLDSQVELTRLEAMLAFTVLHQLADQLFVLGFYCGKKPAEPEFQYLTLKQRFVDSLHQSLNLDVETDLPVAKSMMIKKFTKIQADRAFLEQVITSTCTELYKTNTYDVLTMFTLLEQKVFLDEKKLMKEELQNSELLLKLQSDYKTEINAIKRDTHEFDRLIALAKDEIQQVLYLNQTKWNYLDWWENVRLSQQTDKLEIVENKYRKEIKIIEEDFDWENNCNEDFQFYYNELFQDFPNQIDFWSDLYDSEIERIELDIQIKKETIESELKDLQDLAQLYEQHRKEIKAWLDHLAEIQRAIDHEIFIFNMATRIQAWWKGVMVRRQLGPFAPIKKAKGKGKGKGKGAKEKKSKKQKKK